MPGLQEEEKMAKKKEKTCDRKLAARFMGS